MDGVAAGGYNTAVAHFLGGALTIIDNYGHQQQTLLDVANPFLFKSQNLVIAE